ncbi:MAG TPA: c-type cytochrome [Crenotrichaceae bacterium]|nr:c-type cytochrome [Crenotrichaceae bacterium]
MKKLAPLLISTAILSFTSSVLAKAPLGLPEVNIPQNNQLSQVKKALGKRLFFDKRLSGDGTISCASCHKPELALTDGLTTAVGIKGQTGARNTPTAMNAAYYTSFFVDGRADSLETQALGPLGNPIEHGVKDFQPLLKLLQTDKKYAWMIKRAFNIQPNQVTKEHIAKAIASYERTLISANTPFDRYLYAEDEKALNDSAKRGLRIFQRKGNCANCHEITLNHALFTDNRFYNLGVGFDKIKPKFMDFIVAYKKAAAGEKINPMNVYDNKLQSEFGRYAVTGNISDIGRFKTPTLRNIALTAPYMHDGSQKTLEEVVEYYNKGGEKNPFLDPAIFPLELTDQEKKDLVAFLKSLTSPQFKK